MSVINRTLFICSIVSFLSTCSQQELTIGIVGDQFGSYDAQESYQIMQVAVDKINSHDPDILLHVGDIVESIRGINSFEDYESNFKAATKIMNGDNLPWILAVGDHGVAPPVFKANSADRSREEWFIKCANQFDTPINEQPYYSMDFGDYHFISLYSLENLHTDPRWGSIFLNKISEEQKNWLRQDLKDNINSKGVIIVVHHPMWYVWSNWKEVHDILKEYPVLAVIAGHYHYDQDDGMIDNIRYLVMGSTGGVVKKTDSNTGGVQEYGILKIHDSKISDLKLYEVNSDSILEWTPRISMDRVQAISCMLDNLWNEINLINKDGVVYAQKNESELSSKIEISSLVNPIDIPIVIEISFPDSVLINQKWYPDNSKKADSEKLLLKPGERVGWANYTSVGQWFKPSAIWEAELNQDKGSINGITLSFKIMFEDTEKRIINRDLTYKVH